MAKWCGKIGYAQTVETEPGIWISQITERMYQGDLTSNKWRRQQASEQINDNISISNSISIIADPYLVQHCSEIAYVEFVGTKWKVSDIEVQYPRLILSIGGVYNNG